MATISRASESTRKLPALRILGVVKSPTLSYVSFEEAEEVRAIEQRLKAMDEADERKPRHFDD